MDELGSLVSTVLLESWIRGERSIAKIRLVLLLCLLAGAVYIFLESAAGNGLAAELHRTLYILEALCFLLPLLISIVVLRITSHGRYSSWMRYIPSFLDVSCVSAVNWTLSSTVGLSYAFTGVVPWFYVLVIATAAFRYSSASVVFTGAYAAVSYCAINTTIFANMGNFIASANRYVNGAGRFVQLDFDDEVLKVLVLLILTGLLTIVSKRFIQMVQEQIRISIDRENSRRVANEAKLASEAKSAFLANMSHELRTPMNAILGFGQLMARSRTLNGEQQENLAIINKSATQLLALINDVLDMSKIEAGRTELNPRALDLRRMIAEIESMFSLRAHEKGLSLMLEISPEMPRYVSTDEGKLRQVLVNLVGNAIKFTHEHSVTLRARSQREAEGATRLLFEVEDSGIGIPTEEIDSIFEPFVQAKRASVGQEGTGLGLSICRAYVSLMGGSISVRSKLGKGSTFSFDVRVGPADESQVAQNRPQRKVKCLAPGQPIYRILVADDRDSNRKLLAKILTPLGFEVRSATNGVECISVWEAWEPHLIWMDMRMPVMDGHEATRRIKSTSRGQATVIIALTASVLDADRMFILSEGCDDFLRKPFVQEDILEMLEKHLGVTFLAEDDAEKPVVSGEAPQLTPELLRPVAENWRAIFRKATEEADYARLRQLLEELPSQYSETASVLVALVNRFEYETILAAMDGLERKNE
jgi:signal transduction histidine kinase/FixJ family two-component response regulator